MTKSEIKAIKRQLDILEKSIGVGRSVELEDITGEFLDIYGISFLDEVFYGRFSIFKKAILVNLFNGRYNARCRKIVVGYFFQGKAEETCTDFICKFVDFVRLFAAIGVYQQKREKRRKGARQDENWYY